MRSWFSDLYSQCYKERSTFFNLIRLWPLLHTWISTVNLSFYILHLHCFYHPKGLNFNPLGIILSHFTETCSTRLSWEVCIISKELFLSHDLKLFQPFLSAVKYKIFSLRLKCFSITSQFEHRPLKGLISPWGSNKDPLVPKLVIAPTRIPFVSMIRRPTVTCKAPSKPISGLAIAVVFHKHSSSSRLVGSVIPSSHTRCTCEWRLIGFSHKRAPASLNQWMQTAELCSNVCSLCPLDGCVKIDNMAHLQFERLKEKLSSQQTCLPLTQGIIISWNSHLKGPVSSNQIINGIFVPIGIIGPIWWD